MGVTIQPRIDFPGTVHTTGRKVAWKFSTTFVHGCWNPLRSHLKPHFEAPRGQWGRIEAGTQMADTWQKTFSIFALREYHGQN